MLELPDLRATDLDGRVAYREWEGPAETTFVLLHGLGGSQVTWATVAAGLAGLGRVLTLDLPGFGESPRAGRDCGLMSHRRTLSRFIDATATGRVVACGHSMGAAVALLQAAVEPESLAGLCLTSPVVPPARLALPHPAVVALFSAYRTRGIGERVAALRFRASETEAVVRAGFRFLAADPLSIPADVIEATIDVERRRRSDPEAQVAYLETVRSIIRFLRRPDVAERALSNVRCPTLVIHGRRDRYLPAAWTEAALARRRGWRGRIFPDLGHLPMLEAPGRWLSEVADWHAELVS